MSIENITRRILFVEHQPEILEMAKSEIRQKGIDFVCKVVDTESAFLNELTVFQPHIVILNYVMPGFNGAKVIEILRDSHLLIPFIILTGSINEETSVFCMKAGASDYVLKEQIYRLPDAVVEAIEKSTLCLDDAKNQECLRESLEEYRGIINGMNETVWIINVDGTLLDLNDRAVEVLGYSGEELLNMGLFGIDHSMSKKDILDLVRLMPVVQNQFFQTRHTTKEGKEIPVEINSSLIKYQGRTVIMSVARDISERINREKELRTAEENLRNLAESVGGILWEFDLIEDRWTYVAPQAEKMLGFAPHEWIDSEFWIERVHPDDRLWVIDFLRQSARQGKDHVFEYRFKRKDGSYVWLRSDVIVEMKDGKPSVLKGIKTNIAARKNAEDQLQLLSHSVEQGPASIVITDVNGIIEYVNNTFSKITGYSSEEVLGITPRMFKSGKQSSLFYKALWGNILAGKEWHGELINRKKNGVLYWEDSSISPIFDSNHKITHFVSVREDITEKKNMIIDLVEAKEKAEESDRLKTAFLANVSHEIRTPMNGIMGFLELLRTPGLADEQKEKFVDVVNVSGERLLSTINDLVEISKIQLGQVEAQYREVHLEGVMGYFSDFFRAQALQKKLTLSLTNQIGGDDAIVYADQDKIETALSNLIRNAIKFTNEGGVEFGNYFEGKSLVFFVKDTGIGILPDRIGSVFDRFVQADLNMTRPYEGTGLGLSIVKGYIELLKGQIWIESKAGKGSTFFFSIPYQPVK